MSPRERMCVGSASGGGLWSDGESDGGESDGGESDRGDAEDRPSRQHPPHSQPALDESAQLTELNIPGRDREVWSSHAHGDAPDRWKAIAGSQV